jgi:hypothetical protein
MRLAGPRPIRSCSIQGKATLATTGRRRSKTRCDPFPTAAVIVNAATLSPHRLTAELHS